MNDKELMNFLNSVDDDLIDKRIDELLEEKGEKFDMKSIKSKSLNKVKNHQAKNKISKRKIIIAASLIAVVSVTGVFANDISDFFKSFSNKKILDNKIVDGGAYELAEEIKLNDKFTLRDVSFSENKLDIDLEISEQVSEDDSFTNIEISPQNNATEKFVPGGYDFKDNVYFLNFYKENVNPEDSYKFASFKDITLAIDGEKYNISLIEAESLNIENLVAATAKPKETDTVDKSIDINEVATVAGNITKNGDLSTVQLAVDFKDKSLELSSYGILEAKKHEYYFKNESNDSIISSCLSDITKPLVAYDNKNIPFELERPENLPSNNSNFTTDKNSPFKVNLPAVTASYKANIDNLLIPIPEKGENILNKEIDFKYQKAIVKSIERTSESTALIKLDLNIGDNKNILLKNLNGYSRDIIECSSTIKDNVATMEITFDKEVKEADFEFSFPSFIILGDWTINFD